MAQITEVYVRRGYDNSFEVVVSRGTYTRQFQMYQISDGEKGSYEKAWDKANRDAEDWVKKFKTAGINAVLVTK